MTEHDAPIENQRLLQIAGDAQILSWEQEIGETITVLRESPSLFSDVRNNLLDKLNALRQQITKKVLEHYFGPLDEEQARIGVNWIVNFNGKGYGVTIGEETVEARVKDKDYKEKDIERVKEHFINAPYRTALLGRRDILVEGSLAVALPVALELSLLSEDAFKKISGSADKISVKVSTIDTFTTQVAPKSFQFIEGGVVEK